MTTEQSGERPDISTFFSFEPTAERLAESLDPSTLVGIEGALNAGFTPENIGRFLFTPLERQFFLERILAKSFRSMIIGFWDSLSPQEQQSFDQAPELHLKLKSTVDVTLRTGIQQALAREFNDLELINGIGWWLDHNMYDWKRFSAGFLDIGFSKYEVSPDDQTTQPLEFPDHDWIDGKKLLQVVQEVRQSPTQLQPNTN